MMQLFVDLKRNMSLFLWLVLGDVEGDNLLVLAGSLVVASLSDIHAPAVPFSCVWTWFLAFSHGPLSA